jgi:probable O-glycosylation ligase (exosortase A-associated)
VRDTLLIVGVIVICGWALARPWLGVLGWTLLSIMNLHRYAWSAANLPLAAAIAIATMVGMMLTRDRRQVYVTAPTLMLALFMMWISVTLPLSVSPAESFDMWKRVMKIDFMILVALVLLHTRTHVMALVGLLVFSLGFYGAKGGIFTLVHGGVFRVWGPEGTFIEGNNELALAIIVAIPLMRFLQMQTTRKLYRTGLGVLMILSAVAALGTQSRGALIAIVGMAIVLWWRNRNKLLFGTVIVLVGLGLVAFMPEAWEQRMSTITDYDTDGSAIGRINAWWMCWNLAKDRFFGGGFDIYTPEIFQMYAPNPTDVHAAHSIYFQVLGEQGFIGLLIFLLIWIFTWRSAEVLRKRGREHPQTAWLGDLGGMCQVSLVGYFVGGLFLSLAYFDLPYNILVVIVAARRWMEARAWEREASPEPAPDATVAGPVRQSS